jgi:hypothetical protein
LIPSIPSRVEKYLLPLYEKLILQTGDISNIEILAFLDNKKRTIGKKREGLVNLAKGKYQIQIDDDDDIMPGFISELMDVINQNKDYDVILFNQYVTINNGNIFTVHFDLNNENGQCHQENGKWVDIKRAPFHNMCWKTELAQSESFPDASYSEDWHWAKRLIPKVKTHFKIERCLTHYIFNDKITEAESIFPKD